VKQLRISISEAEATLLIATVSTNLEPTQPPTHWVHRVLSAGVKAGTFSIPPPTFAKCQDKECVQHHVCVCVRLGHRKYELNPSIY